MPTAGEGGAASDGPSTSTAKMRVTFEQDPGIRPSTATEAAACSDSCINLARWVVHYINCKTPCAADSCVSVRTTFTHRKTCRKTQCDYNGRMCFMIGTVLNHWKGCNHGVKCKMCAAAPSPFPNQRKPAVPAVATSQPPAAVAAPMRQTAILPKKMLERMQAAQAASEAKEAEKKEKERKEEEKARKKEEEKARAKAKKKSKKKAASSSSSSNTTTTDPQALSREFWANFTLAQQRFGLIEHACKCALEKDSCPAPQCQVMLCVLDHCKECARDMRCPYPHCATTKFMIGHTTRCERNTNCSFCIELNHKLSEYEYMLRIAQEPPELTEFRLNSEDKRFFARVCQPDRFPGLTFVENIDFYIESDATDAKTQAVTRIVQWTLDGSVALHGRQVRHAQQCTDDNCTACNCAENKKMFIHRQSCTVGKECNYTQCAMTSLMEEENELKKKRAAAAAVVLEETRKAAAANAEAVGPSSSKPPPPALLPICNQIVAMFRPEDRETLVTDWRQEDTLSEAVAQRLAKTTPGYDQSKIYSIVYVAGDGPRSRMVLPTNSKVCSLALPSRQRQKEVAREAGAVAFQTASRACADGVTKEEAVAPGPRVLSILSPVNAKTGKAEVKCTKKERLLALKLFAEEYNKKATSASSSSTWKEVGCSTSAEPRDDEPGCSTSRAAEEEADEEVHDILDITDPEEEPDSETEAHSGTAYPPVELPPADMESPLHKVLLASLQANINTEPGTSSSSQPPTPNPAAPRISGAAARFAAIAKEYEAGSPAAARLADEVSAAEAAHHRLMMAAAASDEDDDDMAPTPLSATARLAFMAGLSGAPMPANLAALVTSTGLGRATRRMIGARPTFAEDVAALAAGRSAGPFAPASSTAALRTASFTAAATRAVLGGTPVQLQQGDRLPANWNTVSLEQITAFEQASEAARAGTPQKIEALFPWFSRGQLDFVRDYCGHIMSDDQIKALDEASRDQATDDQNVAPADFPFGLADAPVTAAPASSVSAAPTRSEPREWSEEARRKLLNGELPSVEEFIAKTGGNVTQEDVEKSFVAAHKMMEKLGLPLGLASPAEEVAGTSRLLSTSGPAKLALVVKTQKVAKAKEQARHAQNGTTGRGPPAAAPALVHPPVAPFGAVVPANAAPQPFDQVAAVDAAVNEARMKLARLMLSTEVEEEPRKQQSAAELAAMKEEANKLIESHNHFKAEHDRMHEQLVEKEAEVMRIQDNSTTLTPDQVKQLTERVRSENIYTFGDPGTWSPELACAYEAAGIGNRLRFGGVSHARQARANEAWQLLFMNVPQKIADVFPWKKPADVRAMKIKCKGELYTLTQGDRDMMTAYRKRIADARAHASGQSVMEMHRKEQAIMRQMEVAMAQMAPALAAEEERKKHGAHDPAFDTPGVMANMVVHSSYCISSACKYPICASTKKILLHIGVNCRDGRHCTFHRCGQVRDVFMHWITCAIPKEACAQCFILKGRNTSFIEKFIQLDNAMYTMCGQYSMAAQINDLLMPEEELRAILQQREMMQQLSAAALFEEVDAKVESYNSARAEARLLVPLPHSRSSSTSSNGSSSGAPSSTGAVAGDGAGYGAGAGAGTRIVSKVVARARARAVSRAVAGDEPGPSSSTAAAPCIQPEDPALETAAPPSSPVAGASTPDADATEGPSSSSAGPSTSADAFTAASELTPCQLDGATSMMASLVLNEVLGDAPLLSQGMEIGQKAMTIIATLMADLASPDPQVAEKARLALASRTADLFAHSGVAE